MLVEHSFVTTMEAREALAAASDLLRRFRFESQADTAFSLEGGWTTIELSRGVKNPLKASSALDLPQNVRLEWDRGRVDVAVSITPRPRKGGVGFEANGVATGVSPGKGVKKQEVLLGHLGMTIATALDLLLAQRALPEVASQAWAQLESQIHEVAARAKRRNRKFMIIAACIAVTAILAAIVSIIMNLR